MYLAHLRRRPPFDESSRQLATIMVENEKLKAELYSFRERSQTTSQMKGQAGFLSQASAEENNRLRKVIQELESTLRTTTTERDRLRSSLQVTQQLDGLARRRLLRRDDDAFAPLGAAA